MTKPDSDLELVYHFYPGVWWGFCEAHFKLLPHWKNRYGYGDAMGRMKCDVPWCEERVGVEVYPTRKFKVSFWVPKKKRK